MYKSKLFQRLYENIENEMLIEKRKAKSSGQSKINNISVDKFKKAFNNMGFTVKESTGKNHFKFTHKRTGIVIDVSKPHTKQEYGKHVLNSIAKDIVDQDVKNKGKLFITKQQYWKALSDV